MKNNDFLDRFAGWMHLSFLMIVTLVILFIAANITPAPYPQPNADDPICGDPVKWAREFGGGK